MSSVIVVEGIHDEMRIKALFKDAFIVTTNGSEISEDTLNMLKNLSLTNEIIIFTDPDFPGEKIRNKITEIIPNAKQAFLRKQDAISKNHKKVGIEHASNEAILTALKNVYCPSIFKETITNQDLYELGLNGDSNSAKLRELVSYELNIGKPNAKTFLKRLNLIQISKKELKELCQKLEM